MILLVDSSALTLLVNPDATPPFDPSTNTTVIYARERIGGLIAGLGVNDVLLIATPVIAEILVKAGEGGPNLLNQIRGLARVRICPFDEKAAIETAFMTIAASATGSKYREPDEPRQKVKVDRQIVAIARTNNATRIYTDDIGMAKFARRLGMDVISTWELPIPEGAVNLFTASGLPADGQDQSPDF